MHCFATRALLAADELHIYCRWPALSAGAGRETVDIDAGEALGLEANDHTAWVEKAGIVAVAVDYRKAPPGFRQVGPKDDGNIAAAVDYVTCLMFTAGVDREGKVIIRREAIVQEVKHALVYLCVVKELNLWKIRE
jgi:hypothetical protein